MLLVGPVEGLDETLRPLAVDLVVFGLLMLVVVLVVEAIVAAAAGLFMAGLAAPADIGSIIVTSSVGVPLFLAGLLDMPEYLLHSLAKADVECTSWVRIAQSEPVKIAGVD